MYDAGHRGPAHAADDVREHLLYFLQPPAE